jgi:hypothetical protein
MFLMVKNAMKTRFITYIKQSINNPWILLDDLMTIVSFVLGLGVIWAFFSIFYALMGGTAADLINPSNW